MALPWLQALRPSPPPLMPPDRADMNTWRQTSLASQRSSAYDVTNRVWNAAQKRYFGPKAQMPLIYWGKGNLGGHTLLSGGSEAETTRPTHGPQQIRMNLDDLRTLGMIATRLPGEPLKSFQRYKQFKDRDQNQVIGVLLHELAHAQQQKWGSHVNTEGGADAFARLATPAILRALGHLPTQYSPGYGNLWKQYLSQRGVTPNTALWGQFGQRGS